MIEPGTIHNCYTCWRKLNVLSNRTPRFPVESTGLFGYQELEERKICVMFSVDNLSYYHPGQC